MVNLNHMEILKKGAAFWNQWREEHPTKNPDLSEANLTAARLQNADLSEANLKGANLRGANFRRAKLKGADLRGANLDLAIFEEADTENAMFSPLAR
jgi:uncharacterized protein YjbI with pentapeptide repeats